QRLLQPKIAHDRADDGVDRHAGLAPRAREDEQQLVAIDDLALVIDHDQAITVAIQRDAEIGLVLEDRGLHMPGMRRAALFVDIETVRRRADADHLGAEFAEYARGNMVGRAMRTVDDDAKALEVKAERDRA